MKFCAFLRGVNVKGTTMKMAEVCQVFEKANVKNVSSVLATGNIIFESDEEAQQLKERLEKEMSEYFRYECFMFLKNQNEIITIKEKNPFNTSENHHIYVFLGEENAAEMLLKEFNLVSHSTTENAEIVEGTLYWQIEKGNTLESEFGKILGRKSLKNTFTSRNINTIEKIINKM